MPENTDAEQMQLVVKPETQLYKSTNELVDELISEQDPDKLEDLTKLFALNQRKKDIARINKLSQLLNYVDDEVANRLIDTPESFDNDQLLKYMNVAQQTISTINNGIDQKPFIQINNQKNEVNIIGSGLNRESRQKVLEAVMQILENSSDVIDVGSEEVSD